MDGIYREQLMEHYKHPQNRGKMEHPDVETTENNPLCGDVIDMQLRVKDGKIRDVKFDGSACAVSIAASSVLTEEVMGKTLEQAKRMSKDELIKLLGVQLTTSRVKCAALPLEALHNLIKQYESE